MKQAGLELGLFSGVISRIRANLNGKTRLGLEVDV